MDATQQGTQKATKSTQRVAPADPGRIAAWLRRRYPRHTAKIAARFTGASERTAEGWLQGRPPAWQHWQKLIEHEGEDFVCEVCLPDSDLRMRAEALQIIQEAEEHLTALARLRERMA
jgi:hypothetical protein